MDKNNKINKKITLEEYKNTYNTKFEDSNTLKSFLTMFTAVIGVLIFACLFFIVLRMLEINKIFGICGAIISIIVYIFVYILPVKNIRKYKYFITNVNDMSVKEAQKYNKQLREDIADKMIDFTVRTKDVQWYSKEKIGELAIARQTKNDDDLKRILSNIYNEDVKNSFNKIVSNYALKIGLGTTVSQVRELDTAIVGLSELNMIKEIIILYGYRPSDAKLMKIYKSVITNSLIAYGSETLASNVATGFITKIGVKTPIVGTIFSSVSQGIINSTLTVIIANQTKKYLKEEYHLQDLLDNVEIEDDKETEKKMINEINEEISGMKKQKYA